MYSITWTYKILIKYAHKKLINLINKYSSIFNKKFEDIYSFIVYTFIGIMVPDNIKI